MGSRSRCRFANELCSALQSTPNQNVLRDAVMQWGSESSSSVWPYCLKWRLQACVWERGAFPFCSGASWFLQSQLLAPTPALGQPPSLLAET